MANGTAPPYDQAVLHGRQFTIDLAREADGRWIADVPGLPGVMAYGATRIDAASAVGDLASLIAADRQLRGEVVRAAHGYVRAHAAPPRPFGPAKGRRVLAALQQIGWHVKRDAPIAVLSCSGWADFVWAFADLELVGPVVLARIARRTGLLPDDLRAAPFPSVYPAA